MTERDPLTGSLVEGYRLGSRLGRGAVASVYAVSFEERAVAEWQRRSGLALKVHHPRLALTSKPDLPFGARWAHCPTGGAPWCEPIRRELVPQILYSEYAFLFQHPGALMPRVYYFGFQDCCFYVMERISGSSLRELAAGGGPRRAWLAGLRSMIEELAAHRAEDPRFYHGDIKPENIILEATTGRFRLVDPAAREPAAETMTPAYNPLLVLPSWADTHALALLVLELFAGFPPFAGIEAGPGKRPSPAEVRSLLFSERLSCVPTHVRQLVAEWLLDQRTAVGWSYAGMLAEWSRLVSDPGSEA